MAALRGQLRALANDRNLRRFVVKATPTGRRLGTGSYGTVEEVEVNGLACAGKKIHEILLDVGNIGVRDIAAKYVQECQLMSDLRHPNITLFLGLCFLPTCQLPLLVMERLDSSLDDLLETVPNIPLTLKRSMLEDVARGLLYLHKHEPQIIHRDLTAKNVLLTSSLVAKITDLGNSRIVNIQPGQLAQTLSRNPGTLVYMPPEALTAAARYGPSLDVFSFGHLGIFVGLQIFPDNLLEPTHTDPEYRGRLLARSEEERRGQYIEQMDYQLPRCGRHPFVQLVKRCFKNEPSDRPAAEEVLTSLEEMKADIEGPYGEVARADAVRHVVMMRALNKRETEVREKTDESASKDEEIHQLQQELEYEQAERARAEENFTSQLHQKDIEIQQKVAQLQEKDIQIRQREAELRQARTQLQQKDTELNSVQLSLERLHADLEEREAQLKIQMKQRDAEVNRLTGELRRYQELLRQGSASFVEKKPSYVQWSKGQIKQTPLIELNSPLKLVWKKGEDMPFAMSDSIQAVVIGGNVYVGGGYTYLNTQRGTVMVYLLCTGSWSTLPPYKTQYFGMAAMNNQLVLVGGVNRSTDKATNVLGVWDEGSQTWTHPFPEMPASRYLLSVASYQTWLIVAGGKGESGSRSYKVELLDTLSGQWYEGSPLPDAYSSMSSAINGNMWYLSRGYSTQRIWSVNNNIHILSVCLDKLISQAVSQSAGTTSPSTPSPWQTLTDPPQPSSTVLVLNGALLAVGGLDSPAIHLYQPSSRSWVKVGDLPTLYWECACTVLPSGEMFVPGGHRIDVVAHNRVDIATVHT